MKNLITILMCAFCICEIMAQNADGPGKPVPIATSEIKVLYNQESELKAAGDVGALIANRQAIIAAWQDIDPAIAAEFILNDMADTEYLIPEFQQPISEIIPNKNPLWQNDLLIDEHIFHGVDMDVALDGTIYVAAYENRVRYGLDADYLIKYISVDNGISFSMTGMSVLPGQDITKIKMTIMDKGSDKYLLITYNNTAGLLRVLRTNILDNTFTANTIATDVKDFDIDVDYEFSNTAQLYAVYIKSDNLLYSARSASNSTGFDWGDEHNFGYVAKECALTYGKGNTFASFVGLNMGSLYFVSNFGYNDPTGWGIPLQLADGTVTESLDISLSAERKEFDGYRAILLVSQRPTGSTQDYVGVANIIQDEIAFPEQIVGAGNIRNWDSWSRKQDDNKVIKTSFQKVSNASLRGKNYNDAVWEDSDLISENPIDVQHNSSAVAEDAEGNTIATYISENSTGLYFDTDRPLTVKENVFNGFSYYPNPTNTTLNIHALSPINKVSIFNILGQQVLSQKLDSLSSEINVSQLSNGNYIMKVAIGNETASYKLIKN